MGFLEYGTLKGLARDFGYETQVSDLYTQQMMLEKAQDRAEAKAKLMTDDMDYVLPMNEQDKPRAEASVQQQLKEIGNYYKNNPDVFTNVQKRIELNRMKKQLKEHPSIVNGLMNDAELKKWDSFVADQKNNALKDTDDFKIISKQRENFLKTGNVDTEVADGTYKGFKFRSPMENFDLEAYLKKEANDIPYRQVDLQNNYIMYHVPSTETANLATNIINGKNKVYIDKIWEGLPKDEKQKYIDISHNGNPDIAKKKWVYNYLELYKKPDDYKPGHAPRSVGTDWASKAQFERIKAEIEIEKKKALQGLELDGGGIDANDKIMQEAKKAQINGPQPITPNHFYILKDKKTGGYNIKENQASILRPSDGMEQSIDLSGLPLNSKNLDMANAKLVSDTDPLTAQTKYYYLTNITLPGETWNKSTDDGSEIIDFGDFWTTSDEFKDNYRGSKGDKGWSIKKQRNRELVGKSEKGEVTIPVRIQVDLSNDNVRRSINANIVKFPAGTESGSNNTLISFPVTEKLKSLKEGQKIEIKNSKDPQKNGIYMRVGNDMVKQ